MKSKLGSITIILMMTISLVSLAHADSTLVYQNNNSDHAGHTNYQSTNLQQSKHLTVSLTESVNFKTDDNSDQRLQNDQIQQVSKSKQIVSLSENLEIQTEHVDQKIAMIIAKENPQSITSIEKLANVDRVRFTGRSIVVDSVPSTIPYGSSKLFHEISVDILDSKQVSNLDHDLNSLLQSTHEIILGVNNKFVIIAGVVDQFGNDASSLAHYASANNSTLLVLLLPLSGYILIRSENDRIKIKNPRQFFCLFFIVILMSSTAITPLSISGSYWGMAFADNVIPSNDTTPNNGTTPNNYTTLGPSISIQNQSSTINPQNITLSSHQSNKTMSGQLVLQDTINATLSNTKSSLGNSPVNETNSQPNMLARLGISDTVEATANTLPNHITASLGILDTVNATTNHITNNTQATNSTQATVTITQPVLPNATKSFNFTSLDGKVGKAREANGTLELLGTGYITQKVNDTSNLKNFTISVLVQPDYSQGSSVFTVISKDGQFVLTINNAVSPKQIAQFSVFDGIKWDTVNSTGTIQNWTHLAATYNGTDIAIYANGTKQDSLRLPGVLTISDDGHLTPVTPDHLTSNSDVVIGAAIDTTRNYAKDRFSGQIKDVNFYNTLLDSSQIQQLYVQDTQGVQSGPISASVPMAESVSISDSIQALLNSGINGTGMINGTSINGTGTNTTAFSVVPTITNLKSSYTMGDNPEFEFKIFKDSDIQKIKKTIKTSMQQGGWNEKNTTISVTVTAPDGTVIPLKSEFKKMKEGKFDIKILSKKYGKPGLYTITATMVKDGKTYTTQNQYAWGLVSLNTQKSTYRPGETANMTIVVLDSGGHPVCNANLSVMVTDPSSHITTLLSGVGVSAGSECGLYNTQYATTVTGNYTVNVSATANSIKTDFNTSFLVQNNIPFDIVRTAQSKIDPVNNPNSFNVKINIASSVNQTGVTIKESVPSVLNVTTDASVQTVGDAKILTWNKNLLQNKTSVQYSYTVPLVFPQLYALGPVQITYGNQTFIEARQWFVANDPPLSYNNGVATVSSTTAAAATSLAINSNFQNNDYLLVGISSSGNNGVKYLNYTTGAACATGSTQDIDHNTVNTDLNATRNATQANSKNATAAVRTQIYGMQVVPGTTGTLQICLTLKAANTRTALSAVLLHGVNATNALGYAKQVVLASGTTVSASIRAEPNSVVLGVVEDSKATTPTITAPAKLIAGSSGGGGGTVMGWGMANNTAPAGGGSTTITASGWATATNSLSIVELKGLNYSRIESLPLADTISKTAIKSLSESLSLADTVKAIKTKSLTESLSLADTISKTAIKSLSESLSLADTISKTKTASLTESLSLVDTITKSNSKSLSESLPLADTISKTKTKSLTESLPLADTISKTAIKSLSESLSLADTISKTKTASLTESLSLVDTITKSNSKSLSESLPLADTISKTKTKSLTESLSLADTISKTAIKSLSESLPLADTISKTKTKSLTESLSLADTISKTKTASLTESLSLADTISKTAIKSLSESLSLADTISKTKTASLTESLPISDSVTTISSKTASLTESLSLVDTIVAPKSKIVSLTDSLSLVDTIVAPKSKIVSLTDSLSLADTISKTKTASLTESLPISDSVTTISSKTASLSESLSLVDTIVAPKSKIVSLTDSLSLVDTIVAPKSKTVSLSESLSLSDSVTTISSKTASLTESLPISDSVTTISSKTASLTESLSLVDTIVAPKSKIVSLTDSLSLVDTIVAPKSKTASLSESLSLVDPTLAFTKAKTNSLSESLSLSDTITKSNSKSLSESLSLADTISKTQSQSLSESLSLSDTLVSSKTKTASLSESLPLADTVTAPKSKIVSLTDSLSLVDTITTTQSTSVSLSESLSLSDTITKSNSKSLSESLSLSDPVLSSIKAKTASLTESLPISDSVTTISSRTASLTESLPISDSVTKKIVKSLAEIMSITDPGLSSIKARVVSLSESLSLSDVYNKQTIKSLSDSFGIADVAQIRTGTISLSDGLTISDITNKQIVINMADNLSMNSSTTAVSNLKPNQNLVETNQKSITIDPIKPELLVVTNNIALSNVTIPSTVTNPSINYTAVKHTSGSTTSVQITNSLTITKDTSGNTLPEVKMTIPAGTTITGTSWDASLILPTTQSSSTISLPASPNQVNTPQTIIKVGSDVSLSFNNPVRLAFVGQAGTRTGFFHSNPTVTEITAICTSDSTLGIPSGSNECKINVGSDLIVWTNHFTGFATWTSSTSTPGTAPSTSTSGAGGGATGAGASGTGASASSNGGGAGPYLKIQKISYDVCDKQIVRIQVATEVNSTNPMVIVRTSITGVVTAKLVADQPYAQENVNATIRKLVYEASVNPKETSFEVLALESIGHNIFSVGKTVEVTGCSEDLDFTKVELTTQPVTIDLAVPKIFDIKFQAGNGTKQLALEPTTQFVNNQPLSVYAIVDTPISITASDLRFMGIEDNQTGQYHDITMNVVPLQISNSTYLLSGTIPSELLQAPGMKYWIHVENNAGKKVDSDTATIGVKPSYPVLLGGIELDAKMARIEGTTGHPTAYLTNNSTGSVYGYVELIVNGTAAYTSPSQIFNTGQNMVNLEWKTPTVGKISQYQLQARAVIFGKSIDTMPSYVTTFPGTVNLPISKLVNVSDISIGNNTIAKASTLYSSFVNDGTMRFQVTASDGTCVIGASDNCLVSKSTLGLAGNMKTVTIGDQVYRVRYSGSDDSLERFSITSVDSLSGNWKVEIDSTNGLIPTVHAMDDVPLKVKYRAVDTPFISENS